MGRRSSCRRPRLRTTRRVCPLLSCVSIRHSAAPPGRTESSQLQKRSPNETGIVELTRDGTIMPGLEGGSGATYLGPRESLIQVLMPKAELQGTPCGREIVRRLTILGLPANFVAEKDEVPQFPRPNPDGSGGPPPLPPMPKSTPLPPRPASQ